jgi:hypothetical protein
VVSQLQANKSPIVAQPLPTHRVTRNFFCTIIV